MNATTTKQLNRILLALQGLGVTTYSCKSCDAKRDAQQNLEGKSHFVDESTLRYFKARVNNCWIPEVFGDCLLLAVAHSDGSKPVDPHFNKRVSVFDAFGTTIYQTEWNTTTRHATDEFDTWLKTFDTYAHYKETILATVKRMREEAKRASDALYGRTPKD